MSSLAAVSVLVGMSVDDVLLLLYKHLNILKFPFASGTDTKKGEVCNDPLLLSYCVYTVPVVQAFLFELLERLGH